MRSLDSLVQEEYELIQKARDFGRRSKDYKRIQDKLSVLRTTITIARMGKAEDFYIRQKDMAQKQVDRIESDERFSSFKEDLNGNKISDMWKKSNDYTKWKSQLRNLNLLLNG